MKRDSALKFSVCGLLAAQAAFPAAGGPRVRVLSGRPDMVTGGSALVEVAAPADKLKVSLNRREITSAFRPGLQSGAMVGRVEGLKPGKNVLEVRAARGRARLELVNYPITGPVFSGPHQTPFICQTEAAGLGAPLDSNCSARTQVAYFYRSTEKLPEPVRGAPPVPGAPPRGFKPYDPSGPQPPDLARTTTTEGQSVPFIVRREMGTINRAIYHIAFLHQPGQPLPDPWTRTPGWNGRLVYGFGGGCHAGYRQGGFTGGFDGGALALGFASAGSSLNVLGNNCNDVLSAETLMMVKEYFIKTYGAPAHTIGTGGSGGSIQQHLIAQNYPGLLDGIIPSASYPDVTTMMSPVAECTLLARAIEGASEPWTEVQRTAVSGFATWKTCQSWIKSYSPVWVRPGSCLVVPKDQVYDPATNPKGVRCTLQDNMVNIYGRDPKTGFARRPVDNVGVQYGLAAFNAGVISAAQFLELNQRMGGFDLDGNPVAERTAADPEALRIAYRSGRVNAAGGSLGSIPIIDTRTYVDPTGDIHDSFRSFQMRARLIKAHGSAANQVILVNPKDGSAVLQMDQWLTAIAKDTSQDSAAVKVARNRPAEVVDACWTKDGQKISGPAAYQEGGRCHQLYPPHGDPRIAAGAPFTGDVMKCALKSVSASDYKQPLTPEQLARLKAIFPQGVCDYSRPGVGQDLAPVSWMRFSTPGR